MIFKIVFVCLGFALTSVGNAKNNHRKPASGSFSCSSADGKLLVEGGDSSAGTWVNTVTLNKKNLVKDKEFKAAQVYKGQSQFSFLVMDENLSATLARVETLRHGSLASGLWIKSSAGDGSDDEAVPVKCEFAY